MCLCKNESWSCFLRGKQEIERFKSIYIYIKYVHVFMLEGELVVFLQVNECLC